jgi:hypothetical protein
MKKVLFLPLLFIACLSKAQIIADFESLATTPAISGEQAAVINNPNATGNSSSKVLFYKKTTGNWKSTNLTFTNTINTKKNDRLVFKINSSTQGRVYVKLWNGSTLVKEDWAPEYNFRPEAGKWSETYFNISNIPDKDFNRIEVNASVDNDLAADVYLDDFKLTNSLAPNGEPIVVLTFSPAQIQTGGSILFDASQTYDADGSIASYSWDFKDGTFGTGATISHTFNSDGIFPVVLTVTDNEGKSTQKQVWISVLPTSQKLSKLTFFTANPKTFEKVEAGFLINNNYNNVYDPDEVTVDAIVTLPDNTEMRIPCFYYQKGFYQATGDQWQKDVTQSYWMVRFSSSQTGTHKIRLELIDKDGNIKSADQIFNISQGIKKGIIRLDANNRQYYRHTTGEVYTPTGINVAWGSTTDYYNILNNISAGKANFVRYWHAAFDKQTLEWKNGSGFYKGLGIYSQEVAAEHDSIINLCEAKGIYAQMVIFHHGMFSENVNSNWSDNPYNAVNGGPLAKAEEFFYNDTAKKRTKKLLRYIVARWGYSPNLFAWELFNEVQFTGTNGSQSATWKTNVISWHDEMGKYVKSLDAFKHLVTTSAEDNQLTDLDKQTGLDIVQYHLYNTNLLETQTNKDKDFLKKLTRTAIINGEYGLDVNTADVPFETQRIAIWTGIMAQVPHLMWLWDNYKQTSWGDLFKIPANFLKDKDFVKEGNISDWIFSATQGTVAFTTVGFKTPKSYYAIVYDKSLRDNQSSVVIDLSSLTSGNYTITYTNILTGESTTVNNYAIFAGRNKLTLPSFSKGIVVTLTFIASLTDPVALAETSASKIGLKKTFTISGKNSYNPSANPLEYNWIVTEKPTGSTFTFTNNTLQEITLTPDKAGLFKFVLTVKQNGKSSTSDTLKIWVSANPVANAGEDFEAKIGQATQLDGSKSSDPENDPITYLWEIITAPAGSVKSLTANTTAKPILNADQVGNFLIKLTVSDGFSESSDTVKVSSVIPTAVETPQVISDLNIYPNPAQEKITIYFRANNCNTAEIELIDMFGKKIFSQSILIKPFADNESEISFHQKWLASGSYLLKILCGDKVTVKKILIKK